MPSYLNEIIGLSNTVGTVLITAVMILMVPLALMFGKLSDKIGNKKVFLIGFRRIELTVSLFVLFNQLKWFSFYFNRYSYSRCFTCYV